MGTVTIELVAPRPGDLTRLDDLGLPPGRMVTSEGGTAPIAWVTDAVGDHAATWARLAQRFPETGLWPLLANGLQEGDLTRPWYDGELAGPDPSEVRDFAVVIGERSAAVADDEAEEEPTDTGLRGLAAATRSPGPVTLQVPTATTGLLLVPVTRPADVPRALGWYGPANYDITGSDQTAVLRSWEDRFGAVLVSIGFDVLHLSVAQPPADPDELDRLAREHYAFCPDNVDQGVGSLEEYAPMLAGAEWWFWWD